MQLELLEGFGRFSLFRAGNICRTCLFGRDVFGGRDILALAGTSAGTGTRRGRCAVAAGMVGRGQGGLLLNLSAFPRYNYKAMYPGCLPL